jgi:sugar/nucleoside kinase (ribokinase family)
MDKSLPVYAVGLIGKDGDGEFLKNSLSDYGLNVDFLVETDLAYTSFSDVMSIDGGQRTFFTYAGASAGFGLDDVDLDGLNVKMLHLGYFLLLDKIDNGDGLELLKNAQKKGIKTSIDLVSENSNRYSLVLPCLKYTDNLIINEVEAGQLTGFEPKRENLIKIGEKLKAYGVRERVIIHTPDLGICVSENGVQIVPSYELCENFIQGTTGAGDAFCAGALYGIYQEKSDKEILEFASAAAVASLSQVDAVSGLRTEKEIKELCKSLKRKEL